MARKEKYKAGDVSKALHKAGGVINAAARLLGCDWHTVKRYIEEYPTVKDAYKVANEVNLDNAEDTLITFVRGGAEGRPIDARTQLDALKFYLRTKGRTRGYGDRLSLDFNPAELTDEELEAIASGKG